MTLNDLERRNSPYFAFFPPNSIHCQADYITVVEARPIMSVKYCLPVAVFHFLAKTITHPAARSLCDSWASCAKCGRLRSYVTVITAHCVRCRFIYLNYPFNFKSCLFKATLLIRKCRGYSIHCRAVWSWCSPVSVAVTRADTIYSHTRNYMVWYSMVNVDLYSASSQKSLMR